jgi:hypothetical protein
MDELRERIEAVERAITDGDGDLTALAEGAASADRVDSLETAVQSLQEDVAELEAATQALRGYVGNVRSVNESVEERADAAIAAVESIEERLPEEPVRGESSPEPAMVDGGHGSGPREPDRGPKSGEIEERSDATQCRTCGDLVDGPPTADGGRLDTDRPDPSQRNQADPTPGLEHTSAVDEPRTGGALEDYDSDAAGPRVTVRRDASAPSTDAGHPDRGEEASASSSPLERLREWL